jgi:hypothetical protein
MHQLQRSWVRSQHPSAQWILRSGSSVEYCTKKNPLPEKRRYFETLELIFFAELLATLLYLYDPSWRLPGVRLLPGQKSLAENTSRTLTPAQIKSIKRWPGFGQLKAIEQATTHMNVASFDFVLHSVADPNPDPDP